MSNVCKDLLWLLSGGVNDTIRHRNALKAQLAVTQAELGATQAELQKSQKRMEALQEKLRGYASDYALPFIMVVALPKSASTYLAETLRQGLNIPWKETSYGYFPLDLLDHRKFRECAAGHTVSRAHIDLNPSNLQLLKSDCPRIVLHLRDPRQALLSMVHYMIRGLKEVDAHFPTWITPAPPADLFQGSLSGAIDWHLANLLPNMLEWIERWLCHAESGESPAVLVTQYQDLRENVQTVVGRILNFYQIAADAYISMEVPKDRHTLYRKGELEEWRAVFSPTQQKICANLMADYPRVNRLYGDKKTVAVGNFNLPGAPARNGNHQAHALRGR